MGSKTLERTGIRKIMEAAGKAAIAKVPRTTRTTRQAKLLEAMEDFDVPTLKKVKDELAGYVDLITMSLGDDLVLTEEYANVLMRQAIATRNLKDLQEIVQAQVKRVAFDHFNASFAEQGYEDPENMNGHLEVPELGMVLSREATGYSEPVIDETKLKKALGKDWEKVYTLEVIPEQRVYSLNEEALWNLVKDKPALLEKIRDSLIPGQPKSGRLNLRNL
jgi:hypothetical protein